MTLGGEGTLGKLGFLSRIFRSGMGEGLRVGIYLPVIEWGYVRLVYFLGKIILYAHTYPKINYFANL